MGDIGGQLVLFRVIVISFLFICGDSCPAIAGSFTIDNYLLTVGIADPGPAGPGFAGSQNPLVDDLIIIQGLSSAFAEYDFWWSEFDGLLSTTADLAAATVNGNRVTSFVDGRIELTVTEPISILVDAVLNFDLPMDQMRASMSVGFISLDGAPIGGGQSFNYNTIFGTGPNSFVYEDQFDIPPGQYLLAYSMDIDATPSSAGAVGTANGFVEFRIVPEPAIAVPVLLFTFLIKRPARTKMFHCSR